MKCPIDESALAAKTYEAEIEIDECSKCGGVWLDEGELKKIEDTIENDYSEELKQLPKHVKLAYEMARQKKRPDLNCPKCQAEMYKKEHGYCSQIIIDCCLKCKGVWLDKGELQSLEVFFERSRIEAAEVRKGFWASLLGLFRSDDSK